MNSPAAALFDLQTWEALPFHFWTIVFAVTGAIVGSFLNVCIHRMPRDQSLLHPPSHCPACGIRIAWRHNIPILSWFLLRGRCAACAAPIPARYVWVEALTALTFAWIWIVHASAGPLVPIALALFAAGLIVATFVDFEHLIIPDEITLGGTVVGILLSAAIPGIHGASYSWPSLKASLIGAAIGAGVVFGILELGKLLFGRQRFRLDPGSRIVFTESELQLPQLVLPYDEIFYRVSDTLAFRASRLELIDRCYRDAEVRLRLRAGVLEINDEQLDPSTVSWMSAETADLSVPREAMGLGDVKFMAAIGAFTGWEGVMFALMGSSLGGLLITVGLTAFGRREWSARIWYGPYLAGAAMAWILGARSWFLRWLFP